MGQNDTTGISTQYYKQDSNGNVSFVLVDWDVFVRFEIISTIKKEKVI